MSQSDDQTLKVWDVDGEAEGPGHSDGVSTCVISANGAFAVTASFDSTLKIWDMDTARERTTLRGHGPDGEAVMACAISPDNALILSGSNDHTLRVWSATTGRHQRTLKGYQGGVQFCAFTPDGRWAVSESRSIVVEDKRQGTTMSKDEDPIRLWSTGTWHGYRLRGQPRDRFGREDVVRCRVTPDARYVMSEGSPYYIGKLPSYMWELPSGKLFASVPRGKILAVSPDGTYCVWQPSEGHVPAVIDRQTGTVRMELDTAREVDHVYYASCTISPDSAYLVLSQQHDPRLTVWNAKTGEQLGTIAGHESPASFHITPDGGSIVSEASDATLRVWDVRTCQLRATFPYLGQTGRVALHPTRPLAVLGTRQGAVYMLELVNVEYGPIIVNALWVRQRHLLVRCPSCWHQAVIERRQLGREMSCPQPHCGLRLRVNAVPLAYSPHGSLWSSLFVRPPRLLTPVPDTL